MKKITFLIVGLAMVFTINAQDEEPDTRPMRDVFTRSVLIDHQTVVSPYQGSLELLIHHRMGTTENGITDLFGLYGASNIRLGLNFGISDKLMVGFGTEKDNKVQEFQLKYAILTQTRSNSTPVSLSYYGNMGIAGGEKTNFYPAESYKAIHRISYFSELILAKKFSDLISVQVAPAFAYMNAVKESSGASNANASVMGGARIKPWDTFGFTVEYTHPVYVKNDLKDIKPGIAVGFEKSTSTHAFQLFATTYRNIINQYNLVYNERSFNREGIIIGFNISATLR